MAGDEISETMVVNEKMPAATAVLATPLDETATEKKRIIYLF